jgi:hypothetical protein
MNLKYTVIKVVLSIIIIILAYLVYASIMRPIRFNREVATRNDKVIERLTDIRNSQQFFRKLNNRYTASFDTLISFIKVGQIPVVKMVPDPKDTTFTRTISDTIGFVNIADSLFRHRSRSAVDSLKYVPFASSGQVFEIAAGQIDRGGIKVGIFEVKVLYSVYLKGLDRQAVTNLIKSKEDIDKYPGLKVGSMEEPSTDGNWE